MNMSDLDKYKEMQLEQYADKPMSDKANELMLQFANWFANLAELSKDEVLSVLWVVEKSSVELALSYVGNKAAGEE